MQFLWRRVSVGQSLHLARLTPCSPCTSKNSSKHLLLLVLGFVCRRYHQYVWPKVLMATVHGPYGLKFSLSSCTHVQWDQICYYTGPYLLEVCRPCAEHTCLLQSTDINGLAVTCDLKYKFAYNCKIKYSSSALADSWCKLAFISTKAFSRMQQLVSSLDALTASQIHGHMAGQSC